MSSMAARTATDRMLDPPVEHPFPQQDYTEVFGGLDADVPVLFAPVRLETRFAGATRDRARHLKIRIYPDQFHVDDHDPVLTDAEVAAGRAYWRAWTAATEAGDTTAQLAARELLAARLPARRAAWVARATQPNRRPRAERPEVTRTHRPARAACLPDRFALLGFTRATDGSLTRAFTAWTRPVRADLHAGVDLNSYGSTVPDGALPVDPGMRWMVDYDEAVAAGMAVTVDLADHPGVARDGLALLLAVGVGQARPADASGALAALIEAHHYDDGVAFVPQGTATNTTDDVDSAWTMREPDPLAFLARELDGGQTATDPNSNARRAGVALGDPESALLARLEHADEDEETPQRAMNRALWPVTWGQYFDRLLAGEHTPSVMPYRARADFERRFLDDVRGGAALPTLRVGAQPYGLLPVRFSQVPARWADMSPWYETVLHFLRPHWTDAANAAVPRMDPVLGATGGTASNEPDSVLTEILSNLPHPRRFLLRELRSWRTTDTYTPGFLETIFGGALTPFLIFDDPTFGHEALSVLGRWGWALAVLGSADYLGLPASEVDALDVRTLAGADAQRAALRDLRSRVDTLLASSQDRDGARVWIDSMITQVEQHTARQAPLNEVAAGLLDFAGILSDQIDDPTLFYSLYGGDDETVPFERPLVTSPVVPAGVYLNALRDRVPPGPAPIEAPRDGGLLDPGWSGPAEQLRGGRAWRRTALAARSPARTAPVAGGPVAGGPVVVAGPRADLPPRFHDSAPLLYQLLDGVVDGIGATDASAYRQALADLAEAPEDRLELRLRETLGLASHRLDAYVTAMARRRLDEIRRTHSGIQLGGYGWVADLVPDQAAALDSQGFIHAPSVQQATTAAILRSGWSAHGTPDEASAMAVDLSGDRVRQAAWLLDGVRQGQRLGALLGYRFERALHDAGRAAWIDPVRRAVLLRDGERHNPRGPVDGLALLDLYASSGSAEALVVAVPAQYLPDEPPAVLARHLDAVAATLDATGDAAIAESVHQVAQGNMTRAAATLDAVNLGEVAPPELRTVRTMPTGDGIVHRVVVLLGRTEVTAGWASGTARARADPELEAWVSTLLGPASTIVARARLAAGDRADGDAADDAWTPVTMAELGVSALDAVFEAPPVRPTPESRWGARIEALVRNRTAVDDGPTRVEIDFASAAPGQITMDDAACIARDVRSLLARCRPLAGPDVAVIGDPASTVDSVGEVARRVAEVVALLRQRADALLALLPADQVTEATPRPRGSTPPERLRAAMAPLAEYPFAGPVPVVVSGGTGEALDRLWEAAWSLGEKAARILARIDEARSAAEVDEQARLRWATEGWQAILGRAFPLIVAFTAPESGPLGAQDAFAAGARLLGDDPAAVFDVVTQVGRVRPQVRILDQVAMQSELLLGTASLQWRVAQSPAVEGDGWVAVRPPAPGTGGRLHWFAADHRDPADAGGPVRGLFVDEWVERVPRSTQTTGVALHFDSPAARPPQALLLAVTPDADTPWSFDLVVSTLVQVLEDATLRAVSPQALAAYGHHLPAIFAPTALDGFAPGEVSS